MKFTTHFQISLPAAFLLLVTGCAVGPDYKRPEVVTPPDWGWKVAQPADEVVKSDWWQLFQDPILNQLEAQATAANQLVQVAVAHVDESRAAARVTRAQFFPQVGFDPSVSRFHTQLNHVPTDLTATAFTVPLDLSYEVDLWGRIRRSFEAVHAQAQASVADYCNVLLTLHGEVAVDYFLLRQFDAQTRLLRTTLALREKSVAITSERFDAGMAPQLDLDRARTELAQTKTQFAEMQRQRDDLQDALALLCGQPAASFQVKPDASLAVLPVIPAGLPSQLLERRPDIAEAERKMAAANAQIGVAKAAFFPAVTLTGDAGYSSFHILTLLNWESHLFQIGPAVTMPVLNGGRLKAGLNEARANYAATCAIYKQQVLVAFKDVSDSLVDIHSYDVQSGSEGDAVASAEQTERLANERYKSGLINYLDVLDAERTALLAQSQKIQIHALQLVSTVRLIKALGGGFDAGSLEPKESAITKD